MRINTAKFWDILTGSVTLIAIGTAIASKDWLVLTYQVIVLMLLTRLVLLYD